MQDGWSIKAMLPALASELDYLTLEGARSGDEARALYMEALDPSNFRPRFEVIRHELMIYCERNTLAIPVILESLCSRRIDAAPPLDSDAAASLDGGCD